MIERLRPQSQKALGEQLNELEKIAQGENIHDALNFIKTFTSEDMRTDKRLVMCQLDKIAIKYGLDDASDQIRDKLGFWDNKK